MVKVTVPLDCSLNVVVVKIPDHTNNCYVFIVNVYIPPSNSTRKGIKSDPVANFDFLQDLLSQIRDNPSDEIVLCGDLNARLGCAVDFIQDDNGDKYIINDVAGALEPLVIPESSPISTSRNNQDKGINQHKQPFLDLTQSQNLLILNGRTLGDLAVSYTHLTLPTIYSV